MANRQAASKQADTTINHESVLLDQTQGVQSPQLPKTDDELLMLAIKDAQFIQPDIGLFTMRFKSDEETRFQAYLLGLGGTGRESSSSSSSPSHQHGGHSSKFSNSLRIWAHPQNVLFVSFLLAVCVNLCLSTAYFLTFIVASMSSYEYKLTAAYQVDFLVIMILFCLVCLVQFAFLFVNLWTCNKAMKKRQTSSALHPSTSVATTEFSGNILTKTLFLLN